MTMYRADGDKVVFGDEQSARAECQQASRAAEMLNRARYLNDVKRSYTAAARLIAAVECLPGFQWKE